MRRVTNAARHDGRGEWNTGGRERRRWFCLPLVGAGAESVVRKERQNQNLLIEEKQNTNWAPEGLPLVGIGSPESHRKERRKTTHTFSDFMIIFRLENALATRRCGVWTMPDVAVVSRATRKMRPARRSRWPGIPTDIFR
jgi:hypothetical protein